MGSILTYKDALPYRESGQTGKVNYTKNDIVVKYTMVQASKMRGMHQSSKVKEMKSDIGF